MISRSTLTTCSRPAYGSTRQRRGILAHTSSRERTVIEPSSSRSAFWESLDAIRGFAGKDNDVAVFYPEDDRPLSESLWNVAASATVVYLSDAT